MRGRGRLASETRGPPQLGQRGCVGDESAAPQAAAFGSRSRESLGAFVPSVCVG